MKWLLNFPPSNSSTTEIEKKDREKGCTMATKTLIIAARKNMRQSNGAFLSWLLGLCQLVFFFFYSFLFLLQIALLMCGPITPNVTRRRQGNLLSGGKCFDCNETKHQLRIVQSDRKEPVRHSTKIQSHVNWKIMIV